MYRSFVIVGTGNVLKIQKLLHICSEHDEKKDEVIIDTLYSIIQDVHLPYYIIYVRHQIIRVKYGCFAEHKVLSSGSNNWFKFHCICNFALKYFPCIVFQSCNFSLIALQMR
jgi:hypothetical protein